MFNKDRKIHSEPTLEKIEGQLRTLHAVGINLPSGSEEQEKILIEFERLNKLKMILIEPDKLEQQKIELIKAEEKPSLTMSMIFATSARYSVEGFNPVTPKSKISSASSDELSETWCEASKE
jgi:hypothetical protein